MDKYLTKCDGCGSEFKTEIHYIDEKTEAAREKICWNCEKKRIKNVKVDITDTVFEDALMDGASPREVAREVDADKLRSVLR